MATHSIGRTPLASHRTIVVGDDGSASGADALHFGRALAEALGAALLVADSPAVGLLALADTVDPIAIVLGPGAGEGHERVTRTAEELAHDGTTPIGIAPLGYAARKDVRLLDIAAAFDGSDQSWPAVATAARIAASTYGILSILTADGVPEPTSSAPWSKLASEPLESEARRVKTKSLRAALAVTPSSLPTQGWLLHGRPADALADVSDQFDLIVTGSRGHGHARRALFGSTTRSLAARSRCPLLVVPRSTGPDPLGSGWPIGPGVLRRDLGEDRGDPRPGRVVAMKASPIGRPYGRFRDEQESFIR